jgi:hypothetical protein
VLPGMHQRPLSKRARSIYQTLSLMEVGMYVYA